MAESWDWSGAANVGGREMAEKDDIRKLAKGTQPATWRLSREQAAALVQSVRQVGDQPFGPLTLVRAVTRPTDQPAR